jgi:Na+-translocating ferredoxin:NAD+ oxidoreductase RNF subunit RnfB
MPQVVEPLSSKKKTLSSNSSTMKKKILMNETSKEKETKCFQCCNPRKNKSKKKMAPRVLNSLKEWCVSCRCNVNFTVVKVPSNLARRSTEWGRDKKEEEQRRYYIFKLN